MSKRPESVNHLGDLVPDPSNRRRHGPRNVGMIVDALHSVGAARSIVIDENNVVLAGNGVLEAAAEAGIERVQVVEADGETIVAVRRRGLTEEQKVKLALFDNRTGELAEWDVDQLQRDLADGLDLSQLWYDNELAALLGQGEAGSGLLPGADPDEVPHDVETRCKPGDLWRLGEHRLLCGDSTVATDVDRLLDGEVPKLMVTDPPYGVDYDPEWRNDAAAKGLISFAARREGKVSNDDRVSWAEAWVLFPGDVVYCWHADRHASRVAADLETAGFEIRNQIIWRKPRFVISRGHYHWQHEPCWYAVRKGATAEWCGDRSQTTVWDIDLTTDGHKTNHGTQKPVDCMKRALQNHAGDVYDPFLGSGTTMMAAEMLGRRCYGMEIDPVYCDVALARYETLTGKPAECIES